MIWVITKMNDAEAQKIRKILNDLLIELDQQDALGADGQAIVTLDQQSVGRLSRMDALQGQAMAKATAARRQGRVQQTQNALQRLDEGEYGYCTDCGEDIAPARLKLDPAVSLCISCASG